MSSRPGRSVGLVAVLALACLVWPRAASAQDEAFKRGLSARGDNKWAEAEQAFRAAIQQDGKESTRKVRSGLFGAFGAGTEYFPYYFLGEALKHQNDCAGAVSAWEMSEDQKAIQNHSDYFADLRAGYKECAAKGVLLRDLFRQQLRDTDQAYNDARSLSERVGRVKTSSPDLWRPEVENEYEQGLMDLTSAQARLAKARQSRMMADFSETRNAVARALAVLRPLEATLGGAISARAFIAQQSAEAQQSITGAEAAERAIESAKIALPSELVTLRENGRGLIARARERLALAEKTQNPTTAGEAVKFAQDGAAALTQVLDQVGRIARSELERRLQQDVASATQELSFVATSFATLERLVAEKPNLMQPKMAAEREALRREQSAVQRTFDSARRAGSLTGVQDVTRKAMKTRMRIDALIKAFGPASLRARGVDAALEDGARAYFAGEYQQALTALEPIGSGSDVPLLVHVHLLRAAALYALYVRSGEKDRTLQTDARAAVQRCKEIDPAFRPDPRAFSPRFMAFFESAAATATGSQP